MLGTVPIIICDYIPESSPGRSGYEVDANFITIHDTNNCNSTAAMEQSKMKDEDNVQSYHYIVDDTLAICAVPVEEVSFHSGNRLGNHTSLSVLVCIGGEYTQTWRNAVGITALLLFERNWDIARIKSHKDWTGRSCPNNILPKWKNFIEDVQETIEQLKLLQNIGRESL